MKQNKITSLSINTHSLFFIDSLNNLVFRFCSRPFPHSVWVFSFTLKENHFIDVVMTSKSLFPAVFFFWEVDKFNHLLCMDVYISKSTCNKENTELHPSKTHFSFYYSVNGTTNHPLTSVLHQKSPHVPWPPLSYHIQSITQACQYYLLYALIPFTSESPLLLDEFKSLLFFIS